MGAISPTTSATPSLQLAQGRNRLEQARREADQAEANAQTLRAQADKAEHDAQTSQGNVRTLASQNQQLLSTYEAPPKGRQSEVPVKTQDFIVGLYNATSESRAASGNVLKSLVAPMAVVNTQGQATGRIVNISA